jgi:phage tail sheath protein FI
MPELLHPGVYIREVPSGLRPIEAVGTSTACFIGEAEKGTPNKPKMMTSWQEYEREYGSFISEAYLPYAVYYFFRNGGKKCYIVRVAKKAAMAEIVIKDGRDTDAKPALAISSSSPGEWGNKLDIDVTEGTIDPVNEFMIVVKRADSVLEKHDNLSMNPDDLNYVEKVVASSDYIKVVVKTKTSDQAGTSISNSSPATSLEDPFRKFMVDINGDGMQEIELEGALGTGEAIAESIKNAVKKLKPKRASTDVKAFSSFDCKYTNQKYVLTSGTKGVRSSVKVYDYDSLTENAAGYLLLGGAHGGTEQTGAAILRPANGGNYHIGDHKVGENVADVTEGTNGDSLSESDYIEAFELLDGVRDVNIICVPGMSHRSVIDMGSGYCEQRKDCFFIADVNRECDSKEEAKNFVNGLYKSSYSAVYFPWLRTLDPLTGVEKLMPPSGFVAGLYARTDATRGVWKAAAGTAATVRGVQGLTKELTDEEQDTLNPIGVNCIRHFPDAGTVIWGARTLMTKSDPEWRYVPIRRTAILLEQSIFNGIQWAVFEPNDEELWSSLRLNIKAFMMRLFREGAFQGSTPNDAFFVKCDSDTTTQGDIDAGIVNILVGFAPLKPAEFVVLKITQIVGQQE